MLLNWIELNIQHAVSLCASPHSRDFLARPWRAETFVHSEWRVQTRAHLVINFILYLWPMRLVPTCAPSTRGRCTAHVETLWFKALGRFHKALRRVATRFATRNTSQLCDASQIHFIKLATRWTRRKFLDNGVKHVVSYDVSVGRRNYSLHAQTIQIEENGTDASNGTRSATGIPTGKGLSVKKESFGSNEYWGDCISDTALSSCKAFLKSWTVLKIKFDIKWSY